MNCMWQLRFVVLVQLFFVLPALNCWAVPKIVNYQGMLTNNIGNPISETSLDIQFALYDAPKGGSELWRETQSVTVDKGVFDVHLGSVTPFPDGLFDDDLYLAITVGTGTEMTPRHVLTSVPYALTADDADTLDGMDSTEFGKITDVAAGTGLVGGGTYGTVKLSADTSYLQRRVISTCKVGSSIRSINIDGSVSCESDDSGITTETDPTVPNSIKDGIAWSEIGNRPVGLDDGDDVGITSCTACDDSFLNVSGDTMTGPLSLPANGLTVGTDQLVLIGDRVGMGTSSPNEQLELTGNLRLPSTTTSTGIIMSGENTLLHSFGYANFFAGEKAGNLSMTGSYNTAIGYMAFHNNTTGSQNTANGFDALYHNTTGTQNTASGYATLYSNTTGSYNTANGYYALHANTTGGGNTASGSSALFFNTTGRNNTAYGSSALNWNTTGNNNTANGSGTLSNNSSGDNNTASGTASLLHNTTGGNNTAQGYEALYVNTSGYSNTAIGFQALHNSTTGYWNTAIGFAAGDVITYGAYNTFIGYEANAAHENLTNATAIGFYSVVSASNHVRIGNSAVTQIGGQVGWSNLSDKRHKKNIMDITLGLDFINALRPVEFRLMEGNDRLDLGFIAQDIEDLVGTDYNVLGIGGDADRTLSLRYTDFIAPLVKAMQEQQEQIREQHAHIKALEKRLVRLETRLGFIE